MANIPYWLGNSNRSRIKRFIENTNNKDQFFKYMFLILERLLLEGLRTICHDNQRRIKKRPAREEWKN